jgi:hypothetical protein
MLIKCDVRPLRGRFYISSFYFYKCATSPRSVLYFFFLFLQMCDLSEVGSIFLLFISTNVRPLRGRFYISSFYFYKCATSPRSVLYFFFLFLQMCPLRGRFYISSFYFYKCATSPRSVFILIRLPSPYSRSTPPVVSNRHTGQYKAPGKSPANPYFPHVIPGLH